MNMPKKPILAAVGLGGIAVLAWMFGAGNSAARDVLEATGTVEGTEALVGFDRAGRVLDVRVREGDEVLPDEVLAVLDTSGLHARRLQATAQLEGAHALLREMEQGARPQERSQATSALQSARSILEDARRDLERTRTLFAGGVVSREALDKALTAVAVKEDLERQARDQAELVAEGPRAEQVEGQRARVAQAEAVLAEVSTSIAHSVLRAPFAGVVTVRHREPGEIVSPGSPAVSILNRKERWVRVYVPEGLMAAVRLRAPARVTTDTYEGKEYAGEVSFIASEAEFTPKTVQTKEERVKLVYSAKVRITGDPAFELKPGMPADVVVTLGDGARR